MRNTLKTIMGLVVIGVVVIATFLYGNAQRQEQLRHDEDIKRAAASPTTSASASPAKVATGTNGGTQPVPTPSQAASSGQVPGSTITSPAAKATPTPTAQVTQAQPKTTPAAGAGLETVVGMTAVALGYSAYRRSRRELASAHILPRG